jgi:site-specific recombinase XerD
MDGREAESGITDSLMVTAPPVSREIRSPLLVALGQQLRLRHYSERTARTYIRWVVRYVRFHGTRHPSELSQEDVVEFLSALAIRNRVSASTQNQAMAAISFLYREVLCAPLEKLSQIARAKRAVRLPVVLTKDEVKQVIARMEGTPRLVAMLLYGSGLRVLECLRLRVKDIDFASHEIMVRGGKGDKDRLTMLPVGLEEALRDHLSEVRVVHERDLRRGGRKGGCSRRARAKVSEGCDRVAMAVRLSGVANVYRCS